MTKLCLFWYMPVCPRNEKKKNPYQNRGSHSRLPGSDSRLFFHDAVKSASREALLFCE